MTTTKRFEELDALRGIAALMVVFFHFTMGKDNYNQLCKLGITGVDLFFIISGFVIFMSLQKVKTGKDFIINRVSRLYPAYWVAVSFTFVLIVINDVYNDSFQLKELLIKYVGNLTMFQYYLRISNLDGPYWTLIIEMVFYILILLLFSFEGLKYLNPIGITLCITSVLFTNFFKFNLADIVLKLIPFFQFVPLFFSGIIFYKLYTGKSHQLSNYLMLLLCLASQVLLYPHVGKARYFISHTEYIIMLCVYYLLFTAFVNNKLRVIVTKPTLFLGKISFPLYLIHQFISLAFILPFFVKQLHINFWIVVLFINLPIIILIASVITYMVEVPYNKKMKEKLRSLFQSRVKIVQPEPVLVSEYIEKQL